MLDRNSLLLVLLLFSLFTIAAPIALWRGKWTFLISGYKKLDPEKTDLTKVCRFNAAVVLLTLLPSAVLLWISYFTWSRPPVLAALVWTLLVTAADVIYEKTGERFPKGN